MQEHILQVKPKPLRIRFDVNPQAMQPLSDHAISQRQQLFRSPSISVEVQWLAGNLHLAGDEPSGASEGYECGLTVLAAEADVGRQRLGLTFYQQLDEVKNLASR